MFRREAASPLSEPLGDAASFLASEGIEASVGPAPVGADDVVVPFPEQQHWGATTGLPEDCAEPQAKTGNSQMADLTRGEFDARLEAAAARTEAKIAGMDAKLDLLLQRLGDAQMVSNAKFESFSQRLSDVKLAADQAKDAADRARSASANVKWNIFIGAVAIVGTIAVFLAFGLQAFQTAIAVFEAGRGP